MGESNGDLSSCGSWPFTALVRGTKFAARFKPDQNAAGIHSVFIGWKKCLLSIGEQMSVG